MNCEICEDTGFNDRYATPVVCTACREGKRQQLIYLRRRIIELSDEAVAIQREINTLENELTP